MPCIFNWRNNVIQRVLHILHANVLIDIFKKRNGFYQNLWHLLQPELQL